MKVSAFIPARFGSTRLKGKPLVDIGGRSLVQWVYERAQGAALVDSLAVATDDRRIHDAVIGFGGRAVMTSKDCPSGTDRVAEAARKDPEADIIVNIQGDEPLIEPSAIDEAIRPLLEDPNLEMSTLMTPVDEKEYMDPHTVKVVTDRNGFALYFSRSPIPFGGASGAFKHIGLYIYRKDFLFELASMSRTPLERAEGLEQLRAIENGFRIKVVETAYNPLSVDTAADLERVRAVLARGG